MTRHLSQFMTISASRPMRLLYSSFHDRETQRVPPSYTLQPETHRSTRSLSYLSHQISMSEWGLTLEETIVELSAFSHYFSHMHIWKSVFSSGVQAIDNMIIASLGRNHLIA